MKKKEFDVIALGELLIDFTPAGISVSDMFIYERNPGGAPSNAMTAVAKQGGKTAFIGKVGLDSFGIFLKETLTKHNINVDGVSFDKDVNTTLAFVTLEDNGERSFDFYRKPGADIMLHPDDIDENLITKANMFHFGSISLTHQPSRSATNYALKIAKENDLYISYDPNLRPLLWENEVEARKQIMRNLPDVDVLKVSEAEFQFIVGHSDYEKGAKELMRKYDIRYIFITLGAKGAFYAHQDYIGHLPTYNTSVVDTTGSGDAFMGAIIKNLSILDKSDFSNLDEKSLIHIVNQANASGSMASTKRGGIPAMPTSADIEYCMKNIPLLK